MHASSKSGSFGLCLEKRIKHEYCCLFLFVIYDSLSSIEFVNLSNLRTLLLYKFKASCRRNSFVCQEELTLQPDSSVCKHRQIVSSSSSIFVANPDCIEMHAALLGTEYLAFGKSSKKHHGGHEPRPCNHLPGPCNSDESRVVTIPRYCGFHLDLNRLKQLSYSKLRSCQARQPEEPCPLYLKARFHECNALIS